MSRTWDLWTNSLPEYKYGTVSVIEEPWWLSCVRWFSDVVLWRLQDVLSHLPFPNWFPRHRGGKEDTELYTLKEWYGDLGQFIHIYLHDPVLQWYWAHPKRKEYNVEIGYDKLRELFHDILFEEDEEKDQLNETEERKS